MNMKQQVHVAFGMTAVVGNSATNPTRTAACVCVRIVITVLHRG